MTATTDPRPVGRPRKLSDAALQRARMLYESGKSPAQIATLSWCKVSAQTLYYHLRGCSPVGDGVVDMRPKGRKGMSNEDLSAALSMYSGAAPECVEGRGLNVGEIREALAKREARERKCSVDKVARFAAPTISKALKDAGVKVRRGRPPLPEAAPAEAAE